MGGSAFAAILGPSAFPRLPPPVYRNLKATLIPALSQYYRYVTVPIEGPEKPDYGDLDLLVTLPKAPYDSVSGSGSDSAAAAAATVPHDVVKNALGATLMKDMAGNRTSNYGIPIRRGEWAELGHAEDEERLRAQVEDGQIFYQVDVRVCSDKDEWDRVRFFHSYGDMGMILGLVARNCGLHLGLHGLKLPNPPNPPFELSTSFEKIMKFYGISMDTYNAGFPTRQSVFEWIGSSYLLNVHDFRSSGEGFTKVKAERTMYGAFVDWVQDLKAKQQETGTLDRETRAERHARIRAAALDFFGKAEEFERVQQERATRQRLKDSWSGSRVRDWTELGEYWKGVKCIMDEVRSRLGGDQGVLAYLDQNGDDSLKQLVLEVQKDLGIQSARPSDSTEVNA